MHGTARPQQSYAKEQLSSELNVPQALLLMKNKRNRCMSLFFFSWRQVRASDGRAICHCLWCCHANRAQIDWRRITFPMDVYYWIEACFTYIPRQDGIPPIAATTLADEKKTSHGIKNQSECGREGWSERVFRSTHKTLSAAAAAATRRDDFTKNWIDLSAASVAPPGEKATEATKPGRRTSAESWLL